MAGEKTNSNEELKTVKEEPILYPVAEVIAKAEKLFDVPSYIAAAALRDMSEVDVNVAGKKIKSLLKREVK